MFPRGFLLTALGRQVLKRFSHAGMQSRLFLSARWRWTPYEEIASQVAPKGTILDLGSGHGLLSLALCLSKPERRVRGIDHDPARVRLAQKAAVGLPNLQFETGSLLDAVADELLGGTVAGIIIMDALHYLSFADHEVFLARCKKLLQPGGVLLIRDVDAGAGNTFLINRLHERMMTSLGFTLGERLNFRSRSNWLQLLADAGFEPTCEPCSRFPLADLLFVCRLQAAQAVLAA